MKIGAAGLAVEKRKNPQKLTSRVTMYARVCALAVAKKPDRIVMKFRHLLGGT